MKRKIIVFSVCIIACCCSSAQTPIYDSTQTYDTVTDGNTFYLFPTYKPCINPGIYTWPQGYVNVQEYVTSDTVTVYGVAIPLRNYYTNVPICDTISFYKALLMTKVGPSPIHNRAYSMNLVDSVTLNRSHPRFCWFRYVDDCDKTKSLVTSCYEFYFDTPQQINRMVDTFYVGRYRGGGDYLVIQEYGGEYSSPFDGNIYQSGGLGGMWDDYYFHCTGDHYKRWGVFFPIIGFRCTPMQSYWLEAYNGSSAVVCWHGTTLGDLYNVRLVGEDGSDTTFVTSDTLMVLTNLSDSVRYNVMLRKQCRYCTSNYDTTVYSTWRSDVFFGTTIPPTPPLPPDTTSGGDTVCIGGEPTALSQLTFLAPNPAHGEIVVSSSFNLQEIDIWTVDGVWVHHQPVAGHRATVPIDFLRPGTYIVAICTHDGTTHKKLLVE